MPCTAISAPGRAPARCSAVKAVSPAHNSGAASTGAIPSGTRTRPLVRAYTTSA
ncbi:hypothetical protein [Kitasatospora griseola]|uniref:hypothetical protein n=1 Tax=Kitasatospora griseola TaxID=2064 RepID=UPI0037F637B9